MGTMFSSKRALALFLTSSLAQPALAQALDQSSEAKESAADPGDIVVTAQRRTQNVQEVPISVTTLSGDAIEKLGLKTSADIAAQVPNLTIKQSFANSVPQIFLRGVGVNDPNANANGAVGIYADDVNLVSPSALTFSLFDTDRVEVLRGPQGTLYGRNTTGGAINFISRRPTDEWSANASVSYGRFNDKRIEGGVGGPIVDRAQFRIAGVLQDSDGFHVNRLTGNRLGDVHRWSLRGLLKLEPTSHINILLNVHGGRVNNSSTPFEVEGTIDPASGGACDYRQARCVNLFGYSDTDNNPYRHDIDFEGRTRFSNFGTSAQINADLGGAALTSITAYEKTIRRHREDADGSPQNQLNTFFQDNNKQISQELRLTSSGKRNLNWIIGAFYSHEKTSLNNRYDFFRGYRDLVASFGFEGGFDPDGANPSGLTPFLVDQRFAQKSNSYAGFANIDAKLSDTISLVGGVRYTSENRSIRETVAFDEGSYTVPLIDDYRDRTSFNSFSGKIGLNYKPADDILLFASLSRGFKSGGYNGALVFSTPELQPFRPEKLTAYEVGIKSRLLDRLITFNASAFYYDYKDIQLFTFGNVGGIPVQILTNAAAAEIYGVDAEMAIRPANDLSINLGAGLLHTRIKRFVTSGGQDLSGNRLVMAPTASLNALVRYQIPLSDADKKIIIETDAKFQSRVFFSTANASLLSQPAYTLWNARLALAQVDDRWEFAVQVRNLLDKKYRTEAFDFSSSGYNLYIYGTPRTWELSLRFRY